MIDVAALSLGGRGHDGGQLGVLPQHLALEGSKCVGWFESEFFAELEGPQDNEEAGQGEQHPDHIGMHQHPPMWRSTP